MQRDIYFLDSPMGAQFQAGWDPLVALQGIVEPPLEAKSRGIPGKTACDQSAI